MNELVKSMDSLPKVVKVLLAIPFLDIIWVVYRLCRSIVKKNTLGIILGILLIIFGIPFLWLVDIITLVAMDKVIWID